MASDTPGDTKSSEDHQEEQVQEPAPAQEEGGVAPAHRETEEQPQHPSREGEGAADEDHGDGGDEGGPAEEQEESKKSAPKSRKRRRKASEKSETATPTTDRPTRERKVVERYSASPSGRTPGSKSFAIAKGSGTQLKDIPNVAFKLSKQKADDNLQLFHTILYGKKAKAHSLKRNIAQFSGFVWGDNEEKQRAKVREKLDKCVKEKLVYFCDLLNIPINKATAKKEELSAKLLDFLESPHMTTDVLLADKEQGQKRKRKSVSTKFVDSAKVSAEATEKKHKKRGKVGEKEKTPSATEEDAKDDDNMTHSGTGDDSGEDNEKDKVSKEEVALTESKSEDDMEEVVMKDNTLVKDNTQEDKVGNPRDSSKPGKKGGAAKSSKTPSTSAKKPWSSKKKSDSKKKAEKDSEKAAKGKSSIKKSSRKSSVVSAKDQGKRKTNKKAKAGPSREEIHAEVVKILKEVDFNTATLSDILKQLGTHFDVDLYSRKAEVKDIIAEVINDMSDEEDEGEDDSEDAKSDDSEDADK